MISQTPDLGAVVDHLERLERELRREKRRNRWLLAAVGLGVVGLALHELGEELSAHHANRPRPGGGGRADCDQGQGDHSCE
jgi:hypothetical protein